MRIVAVLITAAVAWVAACDATSPSVGRLRITTVTSGGDLDADGYLLRVDGKDAGTLPLSGYIDLEGLAVGAHTIRLLGVAENCDPDGEAQRVVTISGRGTEALTFTVLCHTTGLQVTFATSGLDLDPDGFVVQLGNVGQLLTKTSGSVTLSRLIPGSYLVDVTGVAGNCSLSGGTRYTVNIVARQVAVLPLTVSCVATTAVVEIVITSTGVDLDFGGYTIRIPPLAPRYTGPNSAVRIEGITAGTHQVTLEDVVPNCSINGLTSRTFSVSVGTTTRDTARVGFEVHCVRAQKIAFTHENQIFHAYADGSNAVSLGFGLAPAWLPNGEIIAFEALTCTGGYSYPPGEPPTQCSRDGLATIRQDGAFRTRLTTGGFDRDPAWSPAGDVIAFERSGLLFLIRPTGADLTQLIVPVMWAGQPAWSPDGLQIAFTCTIDPNNTDICVAGRDGSGLRRLTTDAAPDSDPAWSPDGTQIAFTTMRFADREEVALVSPAGGNVTRVIQGQSPTWSGDGAKILFAITGLGLATANRDGSGFTVLTRQGEYAPAWRQ